MTFYGPPFSTGEMNFETLLTGRQRFGNRSANMFFVRPARHVACPRRLKYIHDIKTGYIPYVEDSAYIHRPRQFSERNTDDDISKTAAFGLYNAADSWRQELMELAQQVQMSLSPHDEQHQQRRSPRLQQYRAQKNNSALSNYSADESEELNNPSKRLLTRRLNAQGRSETHRPRASKPKITNEKPETELPAPDENHDSGIWLIPLLCYVLQVDNLVEAQNWLVNANPTEKRLAMELISRTMQDMQNHENDGSSEISLPDQAINSSNAHNIYWPFKVWQRQEKDRQQQQQQQQTVLKRWKSTTLTPVPSATVDNGDTCERATSPLRMLTPAKRSSTAINLHTPVEATVTIERSPSRATSDRATPAVVIRQQAQTQQTDRPITVKNRSPSATLMPTNNGHCSSRRTRRVTTSMSSRLDDDNNNHIQGTLSPTLRGKTPLI